MGNEITLRGGYALITNTHRPSGTKVDLVLHSALAEHPTAIDFTVSCPLLPSYLPAATTDPHAILTSRAADKTAKHAKGSADRNRTFLPFVITTFGAIGPPSAWHYIDEIYATSSSLARQHLTSPHLVARRKAGFLALLHAVLIRSCFRMLTVRTSGPAATAPPSDDAASPATTPGATPEPVHD